jgi:hypothetical protein
VSYLLQAEYLYQVPGVLVFDSQQLMLSPAIGLLWLLTCRFRVIRPMLLAHLVVNG